MSFEKRLEKLFKESISAQQDTLWYSKYETLYDAVLRMYYEMNWWEHD